MKDLTKCKKCEQKECIVLIAKGESDVNIQCIICGHEEPFIKDKDFAKD